MSHFNPTIPASQPQPIPGNPEDRAKEFRPVQGGDQMQSGEMLVVEAYAAIWLIVFAMMFLSWRRLKDIDRRILGLEAEVGKARSADKASRPRNDAPRPDDRAPGTEGG